MTSSEDLSREAKHLLRQAKGADRATRSEVAASVQRFRSFRSTQARQLRAPRRATPWAVFIAVLSGTLGAYAMVGQSLDLPIPDWWPEFAPMPARNDATAERSIKARQVEGDSTGRDSPPNDRAHGSEPAPKIPGPAGAADNFEQSAQPAAAVATVSAGVGSSNLDNRGLHRTKPPITNRGGSAPPPTPKPTATTGAVELPADDSLSVSQARTLSPLAREVQTITAARDALNAGNCALAQRHLTDHQHASPNGALSEERRALSAICQCRQGQGTHAAEAYVARRPNSPLARRVASECSLDLGQ